MIHIRRVQVFAQGICALVLLAAATSIACAQGNVVLALDGMIVNNSGDGQPSWGGFGRFDYGGNTIGVPITPGLGRYDAFRIEENGSAGSGVGVNFAVGDINSPMDSSIGVLEPVTASMYPLLDLGTFGANFDPTQYVAEIVYKPNLPTNTATQLNMTLDHSDGFTDGGLRAGEQWQWAFTDLINKYTTSQSNNALDADGFAVVQSNMGVLSQAAAGFNGPSYMYATAPLPSDQRDMMPDFDNFEGGPLPVPNGVVQIHLQTDYDNATLVDDWEIKSLTVRKISPDASEVARLDGKSGFSQRFGSPFTRTFDGFINVDGTDYDPTVTDQVQRFNQSGFLPNNSFVINTDDDDATGGLGLWQSASATVFDGTDASIEIRARLTAPAAGQAPSVQLVAKDKDGNGTAEAGDFGGEEYHFNVALDQFNESTMTTVSIPFSAATIEQAQEFATAGDGLLTDFNLYYLGMLTNQDAGLVDLEVEFVRVVLPAPSGLPGDFSGNNSVENADLTLLLNNWAQAVPPVPDGWIGVPQPTGPAIDNDELTALLNNWGMSQGGGSTSAAVPEPASWTLLAMTVAALLGWRRQPERL